MFLIQSSYPILNEIPMQTTLFPINILENQVAPASYVKNRGMVFVTNLAFSDHVSLVTELLDIIVDIFGT